MRKIILVFMLAVLLVGCTNTSTEKSTSVIAGDEMRVHFINVGQGDSILIEAPNKKFMLIDGGMKGEGKNVVAYLREQGVEQLEYVVATHPDADHIGGLIAVLNSISIKNFVDSGKVHTSQTYEEMITLIADKNIPYIVPETGEKITLDDRLDVVVLASDKEASDNNEASIVLKVTYGDVSFLLAGDAGIDMEQDMLQTQNVEATILKAGHHGSNTSSSPKFIEAVHPEATILSYGDDNKYGHPHFEVIESLQQVGSEIYSTAEAGHIVVTTDGVSYEVNAKQWTGVGAMSSITMQNAGKVEITAKDLQGELVTIKNKGSAAVNVNGWQLVSVDGNQVYTFPNITLQPGKSINVSSGPDAVETNTTLKWTTRQIWLNTGDKAQLLNAKGEIVSELE